MNVVVMMLDSLRPDHVGCCGNAEVKTPHIDAIAAKGAVFETAYAEYPITVPARTALVSGAFTWPERPWTALKEYDVHVAEVFQRHGYATAAFTDTPFSVGAGMNRGFDVFQYFQEGKCHKPVVDDPDFEPPAAYYPPGAPEKEKDFFRNTIVNRRYALKQHGKACPELLFDAALDWLERSSDKPFFLWIDTFEPHEPWCPVEPYHSMYQPDWKGRYIPFPIGPSSDWMTEDDLRHVLALYKGDATHTDEMVGKVTAKLTELGKADNTIVAVISDHGEPFGEHGVLRKYNVVVYDELARMVWVMSAPGVIEPGTRTSALIENTDFTPTLLDMVGIDMPRRRCPTAWMDYEPDFETDVWGVSGLPLLRGEADKVREHAYIGAFNLRAAIRTERWKLIDNRGEKPTELFDMIADPGERHNLAEAEPTLTRELHRKLWEFQRGWSSALSWRDNPAKQ